MTPSNQPEQVERSPEEVAERLREIATLLEHSAASRVRIGEETAQKFAASLRHIIASYEEQPNVLSKEEARLLAVYPMSEGAFPIRCRLERWADLHSEGGEQDG